MTILRARLFVAVMLVSGCVADDLRFGEVESDVIGGSKTPAGKFPGVGALIYQGQIGCTGTLVAPNLVLTAAHCLDPVLTGGIQPNFSLDLDVSAGAQNVTTGMAKLQHENFKLEDPGPGLAKFDDIGLVTLAQPITSVPPVPMVRPQDAEQLVAGLEMEIVGYGKTSPESDEVGVMYDAKTKLIEANATEIQVGGGQPEPQNCNGDSGGPGFATIGGVRRIIGIVSRSANGGICVNGGIDTRVDAYLPWIYAHAPTMVEFPCGSGMEAACATDEDGGCCSTSGRGVPGSAALALLVGVLALRPRRRVTVGGYAETVDPVGGDRVRRRLR